MSLFGDDLLSMDYSGWDTSSPLEYFTDPSGFSDYQSYEPDYFGFSSYEDPTYSLPNLDSGYLYDLFSSGDNSGFDFVNGTYSTPGLDTNQIPYQEYANLLAQENQNKDEGILSSILDSAKGAWDKTGEFLGGKNNMSTLLTLATLASMGQKPKGPVNAGGPVPSSVAATEIYNKFTPQQQANMDAFASKRNLVPLAQRFDPRTYGYGGEAKFFDREA